jgi:cytochrome c556
MRLKAIAAAVLVAGMGVTSVFAAGEGTHDGRVA